MKRYRYAWLPNGQVDDVNRLLAQGWRPAVEVPVNHSAGASAAANALVVLEREDALPLYRGELLGDAAPAEFFDDIPLFEGFDEHDLRELIAACEVVRYDAGSILFDSGDERQLIYLVREGQVSIQLLGLALEDPVVLEAGPKDVFGESTFFAPYPHTTRATAITAVMHTLELGRDRYEELLQAQRPSAYKLAVNAAESSASDCGRPTSGCARSFREQRPPTQFATGGVIATKSATVHPHRRRALECEDARISSTMGDGGSLGMSMSDTTKVHPSRATCDLPQVKRKRRLMRTTYTGHYARCET